jgi:hypothetical protein
MVYLRRLNLKVTQGIRSRCCRPCKALKRLTTNCKALKRLTTNGLAADGALK